MDKIEQAEPMILSPTGFKCRKGCDKEFPSANARNMHEMRVHTKAGKMGAMWKKHKRNIVTPVNSELSISEHQEQIRMRKLNQQRKMRERNIAKGLTGHGTPRKLPFVPRGFKLNPNREAKREYQRKWYWRNKNKNKRIISVYPPPGTETPETIKEGLSAEEAMLLSLLMKKHGKTNE